VGDLYFKDDLERQTLGAGDKDFFETMVFRTLTRRDPSNEGCGCHQVKDWAELECLRYATAGAAQRGHERMVGKYARLASSPRRRP
jgi:hypothetical protein